MKKYRIAHLCLCIGLLFQIACDPISVVKLPDHESRLTVNSYLVEGEEVLVDISKSVGILGETEPSLRLVKDARVELLENNRFVSSFSFIDSVPNIYNPDWGLYKSSYKPKAEHQYELRVFHPELGEAIAQTHIPSKPVVENIRFEREAGQDAVGDPLSAIFFTLSDPLSTKNYYEIFVVLRYERHWIDSVSIETRLGALGSRLGDGSFFQEYDKAPGLLSDDLFDGQSQDIALFFWSGSGSTVNGEPVPLEIVDVSLVVRSCDKHYFEYRSVIDLHLDIQNEEAPLFPAEPISAYSNIEGGYGILGAYHTFSQKVY